ncbi:uncharacterized protein STEHIDRAFT_165243 [Stereum hirsutum FP-91666 SS1]|uniref:uncharacterized protein n=1 Tax=Stereum hirsutum (strain FP-91666) TaxID=721885 RepID=UPI000440EB1B|nr:uncharacterized protein STEHIDRAFT_165243 [Stereum hirsutum FP-91666 SS1]EIM90720.1 hypothetical protein STEHIDRAFT_165243 [Stereum hirsutum FP-91666 SS1]
MAYQSRPEPMNASPNHPKVKVSITLSDPTFVAGGAVTGKMEMECKTDKGLGIGIIMVELFAVEELTSRDHSATSHFLHSRRLFQGPGLPPSNAVLPHPLPLPALPSSPPNASTPYDPALTGEEPAPLPAHYFPSRRGSTTYLFKFPLPPSSPSSIEFGKGLARVRYEVRATVGVVWKEERRLVVVRREVDVVEGFREVRGGMEMGIREGGERDEGEDADADGEGGARFGLMGRKEPEGVVVGEHGKVWVHGRVVGGFIIAGESACVELMVKNHSGRKNTSLSLALTRHLHLPRLASSSSSSSPNPQAQSQSQLQISDTLMTVNFKGQDYVAQPGTEGLAMLVFDVPGGARGVRGGLRVKGAGGGQRGVQEDGEDSVQEEEEEDFVVVKAGGGKGKGMVKGKGKGMGREKGRKEALFEVRCMLVVRLGMPLGSKDISLEIPITVYHPLALPPVPPPLPLPSPNTHMYDLARSPGPYPPTSPGPYQSTPTSPPPGPYAYPHQPMSPGPYQPTSPALYPSTSPAPGPYPYALPPTSDRVASPYPNGYPNPMTPPPPLSPPPMQPLIPQTYYDPATNQVWFVSPQSQSPPPPPYPASPSHAYQQSQPYATHQQSYATHQQPYAAHQHPGHTSFSPPPPHSQQGYWYPPPPMDGAQGYAPFALPSHPPPPLLPPRPSSAGAGAVGSRGMGMGMVGNPVMNVGMGVSGLPPVQNPMEMTMHNIGPVPLGYQQQHSHQREYSGAGVGAGEEEEGKGERASRISNHLRMTSRSRGRSVSPTSHRFAPPATTVTVQPSGGGVTGPSVPVPPSLVPASASANGKGDGRTGTGTSPREAKLHLSLANLPPPISTSASASASGHSGSPGQGQYGHSPRSPHHSQTQSPELHSPRPIPSPKHTVNVNVDPFAHQHYARGNEKYAYSMSKSERVEMLEQLADDMQGVGERLSLDRAREERERDREKTLPSPPVPTRDYKDRETRIRTRANDIFTTGEKVKVDANTGEGAHDRDGDVGLLSVTPKTPTLSALSLLKPPRQRKTSGGGGGGDGDGSPNALNPLTPIARATYINDDVPGLSSSSPSKLSEKHLSSPRSYTHLAASLKPRKADEQEHELSGLDALERRLLADVGTRKLEKERRADVRSVISGLQAQVQAAGGGVGGGVEPIKIPTPVARGGEGGPEDVTMDSAISSLTLGGGAEGMGMGMGGGLGGAGPGVVDVEMGGVRNSPSHDAVVPSASGVGPLDVDADVEDDHISEERTQKQGRDGHSRSGGSGESERGAWTAKKGKGKSVASEGKKRSHRDRDREKDKERRSGKNSRREGKEGREEKEEAVRLRRAAKGRVAEWLGKVTPVEVPDVPPLEDLNKGGGGVGSVPVSPAVVLGTLPDLGGKAEEDTTAKKQEVDPKTVEEPSSAPNPRSSGFVPMATIRARQSAIRQDPSNPPNSTPLSPRARFEAALAASAPAPAPKPHHIPLPKKLPPSVQNLFPPPRQGGPKQATGLDSAVSKYDVRSARGGRGGKVTQVTAIWSSTAGDNADAKASTPAHVATVGKPKALVGDKSDKKLATPAPAVGKPKALLAPSNPKAKHSLSSTPPSGAAAVRKTPSPLASPVPTAKSASVPASVSNSLATPVLSSTASLARGPGWGRRTSMPVLSSSPMAKALPMVTEASGGAGESDALKNNIRHEEVGNSAAGSVGVIGQHMAFGQARLRELIKKYQGQAA